jgi:hypothetical protein
MDKSHLLKELQSRLSILLNDPVFVKALQNRTAQSKGIIEDALIADNMSVSEKILCQDASSQMGVVQDKKIDAF